MRWSVIKQLFLVVAQRLAWNLALFMLANLAAQSVGSAQDFKIVHVAWDAQKRLAIQSEYDPDYYYILYRGTNVGQITSAVDMTLSGSGTGLIDAAPPSGSAFYRVLQVPVATPIDTDGDGIDDVWELQNRLPGAVLNGQDAQLDQNQNGIPDLSDFLTSQTLVSSLRYWEEVISDQEGLRAAHAAGLDSFIWPVSITGAEIPRIYVRSAAPFRLRIYRLGWYGGSGAKLVYYSRNEIAPRNADRGCGAQSDNAIVAAGEHDFGLVECPWERPVMPAVSNLESGLYLAIVSATLNTAAYDNAAIFVVRDDASAKRLVIVNPTDAQAYTPWSDSPDPVFPGGFTPLSFYAQCFNGAKWPRATHVSFNRPMDTFDFLKTDYPLVRFLERDGFEYTMATDYDLAIRPSLLEGRTSAVISGHGEYLAYTAVNQLEQFVHRGGNLVAMAANTAYWQIRYENSAAGLPGPVVVGYKETATNEDPVPSDPKCVGPECVGTSVCGDPFASDTNDANDFLVTTKFRQQPVNKPEQLLFGVQYQINPPANTFELPVTLHTDVISSMQSIGDGFGTAGNQDIGVYWNDPDPKESLWLGCMGWEVDVIHPHALLLMDPTASLRVFGTTRWPWNSTMTATNQAHLVLYRPTASSGHVFGGLGMLWSWGLDDWATLHQYGGQPTSRVDRTLQLLTRNMLRASENNDFGSDASSPIRLAYYFAANASGTASMILKERDRPGRWSIVPITEATNEYRLNLDTSATAQLSGWAVLSDAYDLFVEDVNADGRADLIAKEKNVPGQWYVAFGNGNYFDVQPSPWLSGWATVSDAYNLFAADVNGDRKADLIAKEKNAPGRWYVATSIGSAFQAQPAAWLEGWAVISEAYDLFVGDVNGDGKADLIAKEKNAPGQWYVALSTGSSFQAQPAPWLGGWAVTSAAYNLFVADVNADGKVDLIAKEKNAPGRWQVALSTVSGFRAEAAPWLTEWATSSEAYDLLIADVNGDRRVDLIAKEKNAPGNWYLATSSGFSFQAQGEPFLRTR